MDWERHKDKWPNAQHSSFVDSPPHRWHVQKHGTGTGVLLLHGAGASTHSWAEIFADLAKTHQVVAIDLPGQGFTKMGARHRCGLDAMAQDIAQLLTMLEVTPKLIIGHSAGAAIAVKLATTLKPAPDIISINGAYEKFDGIAGLMFPAIAKLLSMNPATGSLFSFIAGTQDRIQKLITSTGSHISAEQLSHYHDLVQDSGHVNATLAMMAQWSLDDMPQTLQDVPSSVDFLVGGKDRAVPPQTSHRAANMVTQSSIETMPNLGHLMHEEDAHAVLGWIRNKLDA